MGDNYTKPFVQYNNYYDLLYHNKDYEKEACYVNNILKSYNSHTKTILELGSGTGNYSKYLCALRLKIVGIEQNKKMNLIANDKAINGFKAVTADITDFELNEKFDAAIALFHVISYLTTNEKIIACFNLVNKHLNPNSIFVFDVWHTPAVYTQHAQKRVKQIKDDVINIKRVAHPKINYDDNTVDVYYEMTINRNDGTETEVLKEVHKLRHFSTPEIKLFAGMCGFKFLKAEEFLTAKVPGADTWGVCYILQKNG